MGIGAALFLGVSVLARLLTLGSAAVLGRVLMPEAFGIVAYSAITVGVLTVVVDNHFDAALIRQKEVGRDWIDTVFTVRLIFASAIALLLFASAGLLAGLLDVPELADVFRVLTLCVLASGLFNPRFMLLERDLNFSRVALVEVAMQVVNTALAIGLVLLTESYWAAITGMVGASLTRTALSWALVPQPLGLGLSRWRESLGFSSWLVLLAVLNALSGQIDRIVTGALLGLSVLGRFRFGAELASSAVYLVQRPLVRVAYPGLAAARSKGIHVGAAFLRFQALVLIATAPMAVAASAVAPWIVRILVGEPWPEAVLTLQVLGLLPILQTLTAGTNSLLLVDGRTWISFTRQLMTFLLSIPLFWYGGTHHGLVGILGAAWVTALLATLLTLLVILRVAGLSLLDLVLALRGVIVGTALSAAAAYGLASALPPAGGASIALSLLACTAITIAAFAAHGAGVFGAWLLLGRPPGAEAAIVEILAHRLTGRAPRRS